MELIENKKIASTTSYFKSNNEDIADQIFHDALIIVDSRTLAISINVFGFAFGRD